MAKKVINRVYPNAEEKLVKNTIVYADRSTGYMYYDEAHEHGVAFEEAINLFYKGLIVKELDTHYYVPVFMDSSRSEVTIIAFGGAPEPVAKTFKSLAKVYE